MGYTIYRSSDGSAPSLTGQTGSLVAVLDACLVNGYGAKAAAGWAKTFSGTSKAAYRAAAGNRLYLRIQDDGPGGGTFKEARATGYETMSDVDTGTGPFPTAALGVGSAAMLVVRKSLTADATARAWIVVADGRTFYMFVLTGDAAATYVAWGFGEFFSVVPSDAWRSFIVARGAENNAANTSEMLDKLAMPSTTNSAWIYMPRAYTGASGGVIGIRFGDSSKMGSLAVIGGVLPYPNSADGGIYLSPIWISDNNTPATPIMRGRMRGMWHICHPPSGSVADGDTISGVGELAGKSFLFIKLGQTGGVYSIETSDTLETN